MATLYARKTESGWALFKTRQCLGEPFRYIRDDLPHPLGGSIHIYLGDRLTDPPLRLERFTVEHVT